MAEAEVGDAEHDAVRDGGGVEVSAALLVQLVLRPEPVLVGVEGAMRRRWGAGVAQVGPGAIVLLAEGGGDVALVERLAAAHRAVSSVAPEQLRLEVCVVTHSAHTQNHRPLLEQKTGGC